VSGRGSLVESSEVCKRRGEERDEVRERVLRQRERHR
jgi:hypothetical protein